MTIQILILGFKGLIQYLIYMYFDSEFLLTSFPYYS